MGERLSTKARKRKAAMLARDRHLTRLRKALPLDSKRRGDIVIEHVQLQLAIIRGEYRYHLNKWDWLTDWS